MAKLCAALALIMLLLIPGISSALTSDQEALVGLKGVYVLVEYIRPELERLGIIEKQIKTDVELRLRKAGVRVLTKVEKSNTPDAATLYVKENGLITSRGLYLFSIDVQLLQLVTLARGSRVVGCIWIHNDIGIVGIDNISKIRPRLADLVDKFINDYLAANPKR
jgi:hypothetical protein